MGTVTEASEHESKYPQSWRWDEDGDSIFGRFVKFDRGQTKDWGKKPIVVLDVDGVERSVWLMSQVIFRQFRDEVRDRPGQTLTVGERISIRRLEPRVSESSGREYRPFETLFPDRPEPTTAELFELEAPAGDDTDKAPF